MFGTDDKDTLPANKVSNEPSTELFHYGNTSYATNSSLDFDIGSVFAEDVDLITFYEDGESHMSSLVEAVDSNGTTGLTSGNDTMLIFMYDNGKIVGSYKVRISVADSELVQEDSYCIMYDDNANVIFKSDITAYFLVWNVG